MSLCPECLVDISDCGCALCDSDCMSFSGSGNTNPLVPSAILDPDENNLLTCSVAGLLVKLPPAILDPPKCQAYHNANTSVPNRDSTVVALNSERYDNGAMHDLVTLNSRITFTTAGVYVCTFNCAFAGNIVGDRHALIRKNGNEFLGMSAKHTTNSASFELGLSVTVQESFEVGEFVEAIVKQDSGGALNLLATRYSPILSVRYRRGPPT